MSLRSRGQRTDVGPSHQHEQTREYSYEDTKPSRRRQMTRTKSTVRVLDHPAPEMEGYGMKALRAKKFSVTIMAVLLAVIAYKKAVYRLDDKLEQHAAEGSSWGTAMEYIHWTQGTQGNNTTCIDTAGSPSDPTQCPAPVFPDVGPSFSPSPAPGLASPADPSFNFNFNMAGSKLTDPSEPPWTMVSEPLPNKGEGDTATSVGEEGATLHDHLPPTMRDEGSSGADVDGVGGHDVASEAEVTSPTRDRDMMSVDDDERRDEVPTRQWEEEEGAATHVSSEEEEEASEGEQVNGLISNDVSRRVEEEGDGAVIHATPVSREQGQWGTDHANEEEEEEEGEVAASPSLLADQHTQEEMTWKAFEGTEEVEESDDFPLSSTSSLASPLDCGSLPVSEGQGGEGSEPSYQEHDASFLPTYKSDTQEQEGVGVSGAVMAAGREESGQVGLDETVRDQDLVSVTEGLEAATLAYAPAVEASLEGRGRSTATRLSAEEGEGLTRPSAPISEERRGDEAGQEDVPLSGHGAFADEEEEEETEVPTPIPTPEPTSAHDGPDASDVESGTEAVQLPSYEEGEGAVDHAKAAIARPFSDDVAAEEPLWDTHEDTQVIGEDEGREGQQQEEEVASAQAPCITTPSEQADVDSAGSEEGEVGQSGSGQGDVGLEASSVSAPELHDDDVTAPLVSHTGDTGDEDQGPRDHSHVMTPLPHEATGHEADDVATLVDPTTAMGEEASVGQALEAQSQAQDEADMTPSEEPSEEPSAWALPLLEPLVHDSRSQGHMLPELREAMDMGYEHGEGFLQTTTEAHLSSSQAHDVAPVLPTLACEAEAQGRGMEGLQMEGGAEEWGLDLSAAGAHEAEEEKEGEEGDQSTEIGVQQDGKVDMRGAALTIVKSSAAEEDAASMEQAEVEESVIDLDMEGAEDVSADGEGTVKEDEAVEMSEDGTVDRQSEDIVQEEQADVMAEASVEGKVEAEHEASADRRGALTIVENRAAGEEARGVDEVDNDGGALIVDLDVEGNGGADDVSVDGEGTADGGSGAAEASAEDVSADGEGTVKEDEANTADERTAAETSEALPPSVPETEGGMAERPSEEMEKEADSTIEASMEGEADGPHEVVKTQGTAMTIVKSDLPAEVGVIEEADMEDGGSVLDLDGDGDDVSAEKEGTVEMEAAKSAVDTPVEVPQNGVAKCPSEEMERDKEEAESISQVDMGAAMTIVPPESTDESEGVDSDEEESIVDLDTQGDAVSAEKEGAVMMQDHGAQADALAEASSGEVNETEAGVAELQSDVTKEEEEEEAGSMGDTGMEAEAADMRGAAVTIVKSSAAEGAASIEQAYSDEEPVRHLDIEEDDDDVSVEGEGTVKKQGTHVAEDTVAEASEDGEAFSIEGIEEQEAVHADMSAEGQGDTAAMEGSDTVKPSADQASMSIQTSDDSVTMAVEAVDPSMATAEESSGEEAEWEQVPEVSVVESHMEVDDWALGTADLSSREETGDRLYLASEQPQEGAGVMASEDKGQGQEPAASGVLLDDATLTEAAALMGPSAGRVDRAAEPLHASPSLITSMDASTLGTEGVKRSVADDVSAEGQGDTTAAEAISLAQPSDELETTAEASDGSASMAGAEGGGSEEMAASVPDVLATEADASTPIDTVEQSEGMGEASAAVLDTVASMEDGPTAASIDTSSAASTQQGEEDDDDDEAEEQEPSHAQGSPTAGMTEAMHDQMGNGSEAPAATLEAVEGGGAMNEAPIELREVTPREVMPPVVASAIVGDSAIVAPSAIVGPSDPGVTGITSAAPPLFAPVMLPDDQGLSTDPAGLEAQGRQGLVGDYSQPKEDEDEDEEEEIEEDSPTSQHMAIEPSEQLEGQGTSPLIFGVEDLQGLGVDSQHDSGITPWPLPSPADSVAGGVSSEALAPEGGMMGMASGWFDAWTKHFTFSQDDVQVEAPREDMPVEEAEEGTAAEPENGGQMTPEADVGAELMAGDGAVDVEEDNGGAQALSAAGETGLVAAIARGIAKAVGVVGPPMEAHDAPGIEAARSVEMADAGVQGEGQVQEETPEPGAVPVEASSGMVGAATADVAGHEEQKEETKGADDNGEEKGEKAGWGMRGLMSGVKRRLGKGAEDQRARDAEERRKHRRERLAAFLDDALGLE